MVVIDSYSTTNGMIKVNFLTNLQVKINAKREFIMNGLWTRFSSYSISCLNKVMKLGIIISCTSSMLLFITPIGLPCPLTH